MPTITVYDRKGNPITLEAVGNGLYEKLKETDEGEIKRTANIVNLNTSLNCGSLFTEEQHEKFLKRQKKKGTRK